MRVISQDGTLDVPYENVTLEESYAGKFGDGLDRREIVAYFALQERHKCIALYSSEEKAIKAMEMLRKAYEDNKFYHYMSATDTFEKAVSYLNNEEFKEVTAEYFQFPQDDEIEV